MTAPRGGSVALKAVRGAAWTIGTGVGSRALGLFGTVLITYFIARDELGEVSDAAVAVVLANQFSACGVGQYYISRASAGRSVAWHATMVHLLLGLAALGGVLALGHPLGAWMRAPALERFLPGLVLSGLLERLAYMPERVLARDMRFRVIGVCRTAAELTYTFTSVGLAALGHGGMSIVIANVARSSVRLIAMAATVPRADWLEPSPLSLPIVRAMFRFGLPTSVGTAAGFASRRVDNAIVSGLFGTDVVSAYNLAYNLADVPAVQVGEQIGDVLLPSFSAMSGGERKTALVRSTGLLAFVTFPLAVGLGAIAPTLVDAVLKPDWHDVGPMLALLSVLSVVRPIGWTISSYLMAQDRPRIDAVLEVGKLVGLIALLLTMGRLGPLWTCGAVGIAFGLHALASMWVVQAIDGISAVRLAARCAAPLLACVPMVVAVLAVRIALAHAVSAPRGVGLFAEIVAGALAYGLSVMLLARPLAREVLDLLRRATQRGLVDQPAE
ncbi:MAG TPA: oligosaccharide flippase family protein [Polyangiaceae bacterium]|nr:oligosaccharide flippase family protein [Polyangiaceae bacterium]